MYNADLFAASGQCIRAGKPGHGLLSDAARHGPHTLRGAGRAAGTRGPLPRGLTSHRSY